MGHVQSFDYFILAILVILTLIMLAGKGSWLLSMGKSGKEAMKIYDEKKATRLMTVMVVLITIVQAAFVFLSDKFTVIRMIYGPAIIIVAIVCLVVMTTKCKIKK
ncbi:DUF3784 domain-containing protein [Lactonifactor longoviformis]|uniref:DUF3784 domain-containing protein n=2 Tax=Lactonifactor TaxID=420345 RepID=A0A1M4VQL8_9CLOT|nr:DUF3784 domain-containing protein [Lactonifactor longoviformis]SHE71102.1 protein of unknown function [Lactonifactor longoviformis DSM 17459]